MSPWKNKHKTMFQLILRLLSKLRIQFEFWMQVLRRDSESARDKKDFDALENDAKVNFDENIPGNVQFQKNKGWAWTPCSPLPPLSEGMCLDLLKTQSRFFLKRINCSFL